MSNYTPTGVPVQLSRGTTAALRNEFAMIATAIATKTDGTLTITLQADITALQNTRSLKAGDTYSGVHNYTGATLRVAAPASGSDAVTKTYADQLAFQAALPNQAGNSGKFVTTDGSSASWSALPTATAASVTYAPNGGITATDTQAAITQAAQQALAIPATAYALGAL